MSPALLLTRPRTQAGRFARALAERMGAQAPEAVIAPLLEIVPRPLPDPEEAARAAGLIFTSENGVAGFAAQAARRDWPVWCVGTRTAAAARAAGFAPVRSAHRQGGNAEALLRLLCETRPETPLLHLRGAHARGDLAERLTAAGLPCTAQVVYDQQPCPLSPEARALLSRHGDVIVPLFSPRSARLLVASLPSATRAQLWPVAISAAAAEAWQAARADPVCLAARPDAKAMLGAVQRIAARLRLERAQRKD
ncbi:uroporphyrinogen-III synthase [Alkalilacustris brevis]|uniref:uroporphyrinogen-III synthase n=1 Tax=Alkalilacustris brevis TaxID=2026338 RepID=UPI001EE41825|nr:uroporphyrinogen-III synthase [Alkalilacustris brevis]